MESGSLANASSSRLESDLFTDNPTFVKAKGPY